MVSEKHKRWHRWFAWYPVRSISNDQSILWFRTVERIYSDAHGAWLHQNLGWRT